MSGEDIKLTYQAPLTHRTHGPGLILFLSDSYVEKQSSGPVNLDPPPAQKWAEEGFCVLSVPATNTTGEWDKLVERCMDELGAKPELDQSFSFGVIVYESELVSPILQVAKAFKKISCVVAYTDPEHALSPVEFPCPVLQHACSWSTVATQPPVQNADSQVTTYTYILPAHAHSFIHPYSLGYDHTHAALAHTRTLTFLRKHIGGPVFDIEAIWEAHTRFEFEGRDVEGTMGTMVAEPYVNHIPTITGGIGRKALTSFYTHHFIHSNPESTRLELVSRTIGPDRVVDEFNFEFTHDREIDWMLPGVPPTGKHVRVPFVAVVNVRGDKLYHEHIYWDQASVLVQIGLLPERLAFPGTSNAIRLPVYGVEQAEKMLDPGSRESNLLINKAPRE